MLRLIIIYILRENVEASKLLYFYSSKSPLRMVTIISRNTSEKQ